MLLIQPKADTLTEIISICRNVSTGVLSSIFFLPPSCLSSHLLLKGACVSKYVLTLSLVILILDDFHMKLEYLFCACLRKEHHFLIPSKDEDEYEGWIKVRLKINFNTIIYAIILCIHLKNRFPVLKQYLMTVLEISQKLVVIYVQ